MIAAGQATAVTTATTKLSVQFKMDSIFYGFIWQGGGRLIKLPVPADIVAAALMLRMQCSSTALPTTLPNLSVIRTKVPYLTRLTAQLSQLQTRSGRGIAFWPQNMLRRDQIGPLSQTLVQPPWTRFKALIQLKLPGFNALAKVASAAFTIRNFR